MPAASFQNLSSYYDEFIDPFIPAHNAFFIRIEHLMRYVFAKRFVQKKKLGIVYDIACGDGYGTKILSAVAKQVYGFDVSEQFLAIAKDTYSGRNINYVYKNFDQDNISFTGFPEPDAIVSFETLEHVDDPQHLLKMFYVLLPKNGYLLLSTPNAKLEPKKKGKSRNKFHKHIFEQNELIGLFQEIGFTVEQVYGQSLSNILFHDKVARNILNKITDRSLFLFKLFSYIGYPNKLFKNRSYSFVVVARKK